MLAVLVLAAQLVYCKVPVPGIASRVRQHGWILMAASAAVQLYEGQHSTQHLLQSPLAQSLLTTSVRLIIVLLRPNMQYGACCTLSAADGSPTI
jgi:hypothetical protein